MFLILLLLEFLPFLFLASRYLLLLLVLRSSFGLPVFGGALVALQVEDPRMDGRAGSTNIVVTPALLLAVVVFRTRLISGTICAAIGWRSIRRPCRFSHERRLGR